MAKYFLGGAAMFWFAAATWGAARGATGPAQVYALVGIGLALLAGVYGRRA